MAITDIFKVQQYKTKLESLQKEYNTLKEQITPEMKDFFLLQQKIQELQTTISSREKEITELDNVIQQKNNTISSLEATISDKKSKIVFFNDEILVQEFGLYTPRYDFANSSMYKDKLSAVRARQKECIKNGTALSGNANWTVNGSLSQGKKMVKDMQKLLLRAFNSECDETIGKIKYNNIDASVKKIQNSSVAISKLGNIMGIAITSQYYNLKIQEAYLALEYQLQKQKEKEEAKEARAQMREAAKLQKEIEEQRKKIEKEQAHYQKALLSIMKQLESASDSNKEELQAKRNELESVLGNIELSLKNIDYREANQRAGYVYIISNIGSFGENVYKIGMTRRLDPQERIDELGDASVPFNFDVHAMIFSDDAPALESALHKAFEDKKLNMVNTRREFFNVTLDEIKDVIRKNFDKTVEFVDTPEANQYRISLKMSKEKDCHE